MINWYEDGEKSTKFFLNLENEKRFPGKDKKDRGKWK